MEKLEELIKRIDDLEYQLTTVEHIQHEHNRKHRVIETGKSYQQVVEDENKLTEKLDKNLKQDPEE